MLYVHSQTPARETNLRIEKEPLLEFLFHDAPDAIFILEPNSYSIVDCNTKAVKLFEAETKSSLISLPSFRLYDSEPSEFSRDLLERNIRTGGEHSQELAFRTIKQNVFWGKLTKRSFKTDEQELIILRISKAVDNLRSEETISALLRGTAKVTGNKFFKELTRLLCRTFDVSFAFVGKIDAGSNQLNILESSGNFEHTDIENYNIERSILENLQRGFTTFYPRGATEMFPADEFVRVNKVESFMGTPVFGNSGEVVGMIGFMHGKPIEEVPNSRYVLSIFASRTAAEIQRIRSKQILKEQARNLANTNSVKDKLLSVISHDLINPLHTIMGFSELLRSKVDVYDKSKIVERVEIIDNSIRNVYFMLDNLNSWSGIYREKLRPQIQLISLKDAIEENLSLFRFIIEIKELEIKINLTAGNEIYADEMMLHTIVRNLLSNAVKYTPKKGEIRVFTEKTDKGLKLHIRDNGIGIAREDLVRLNTTDSNQPEVQLMNKKGTGLGLILSRNYANKLGGNLVVFSTEGEGTDVEIFFPEWDNKRNAD